MRLLRKNCMVHNDAEYVIAEVWSENGTKAHEISNYAPRRCVTFSQWKFRPFPPVQPRSAPPVPPLPLRLLSMSKFVHSWPTCPRPRPWRVSGRPARQTWLTPALVPRSCRRWQPWPALCGLVHAPFYAVARVAPVRERRQAMGMIEKVPPPGPARPLPLPAVPVITSVPVIIRPNSWELATVNFSSEYRYSGLP